LRDTHEINQAISSLRPWDAAEEKNWKTSKQQLLAYAFLKFQLAECILAIHRPYLKSDNSKFGVSENVCYQISQDMLLLNRKLAGLGIQNLTLLREDLLLASLSIVRITMLQPKGNFLLLLSRHGDRLQRLPGKVYHSSAGLTPGTDSSSIIVTHSETTIALLEQCLPLMDERHLSCFHGEPW
jgi:hypothetical protein